MRSNTHFVPSTFPSSTTTSTWKEHQARRRFSAISLDRSSHVLLYLVILNSRQLKGNDTPEQRLQFQSLEQHTCGVLWLHEKRTCFLEMGLIKNCSVASHLIKHNKSELSEVWMRRASKITAQHLWRTQVPEPKQPAVPAVRPSTAQVSLGSYQKILQLTIKNPARELIKQSNTNQTMERKILCRIQIQQ